MMAEAGPNDLALMATSQPLILETKVFAYVCEEGGRLKGGRWRADPTRRAAINFALKRSIRDDV